MSTDFHKPLDSERSQESTGGNSVPEEVQLPGQEPPLTRIRDPYTLSATREETPSEADRLVVRRFLEVLAEVALAVASRQAEGKLPKGK